MAQRHPWQLPTPFQEATREVDRLFDEMIHRRWGRRPDRPQAWAPQLDLYETKTAFVLEADLPGVSKQSIAVEVKNGELVLRGIRSVSHTGRGENVFRQERHSGRFVRRVRLPAPVNPDRLRATFRNGVLRVSLPKIRTTGRRRHV